MVSDGEMTEKTKRILSSRFSLIVHSWTGTFRSDEPSIPQLAQLCQKQTADKHKPGRCTVSIVPFKLSQTMAKLGAGTNR